jgi:hypothetical protein
MSTRFYAGQKDYIVQLNLMDDSFTAATNTVVSDTTTNASVFPTFAMSAIRASEPARVQFEAVLQSVPLAHLTATAFSGPLTGNVTGNLTGTASQATNSTNSWRHERCDHCCNVLPGLRHCQHWQPPCQGRKHQADVQPVYWCADRNWLRWPADRQRYWQRLQLPRLQLRELSTVSTSTALLPSR